MGAARVLGSLFALFAGLLILIINAVSTDALVLGGAAQVSWIINLLIGLLAVIGGLIGFGTRSSGGLVIACGVLSLFLGLLSFLVADFQILFAQFSTFQVYLSVGPWSGITFEAILMLLGGILIAASE
ncbi:MAG: hypothetical protein ACTSRS_08875 [Candidatus Helarchaeota archaeon]